MKKSEYEDIVVSTKNVKKRTVLFILTVLVAVCAFAIGIGRLTYKEAGYYQIDANLSDEASHAGDGIFLTCYLDGKSRDIREALNRIKDLYSAALERSYKLLDADKEYEGYCNLATVNNSCGEEIEVGEALLNILLDADSRSGGKNNFSLYSNPLIREWDSILSLTEPEEYDPVRNEDSRQRLESLAELCSDTDLFSVTVTDQAAGRIRVEVSEEAAEKLQELEIDCGLLSLGRLTEAYRLTLIRDALEEAGFTNGYLTTNNGLSLALRDYDRGLLTVYGYEDQTAKQMAAFAFPKGGSAAMMRAFGMTENEALYYKTEDNGKILFRHPWFSLEKGDYPGLLASCAVVSEKGDIVETSLEALNLFAAYTPDEIEQNARKSENKVVWTLLEEGGTLYGNTAEFEKVADGVKTQKVK